MRKLGAAQNLIREFTRQRRALVISVLLLLAGLVVLPTIVADRSPLSFAKQRGAFAAVIQDHTVHTGNVFFVMTGGTDTAGFGLHPDRPFATVDFAVGQCTANQGDVIYVMPGYAETISEAAGLDLDVAGISVIGLGKGDARPTFSFSATGSTIEINADDIYLENVLFVGTNTGGVTVALDIKTAADDTYIRNVEWRETANTLEFLKGWTTEATISRVTFDGCRVKGVAGGDSLSWGFTEGAITDLVIKGCVLNGDWSVAAIDLDATAITTPEIYDTIITNSDTGAGLGVIMNSATILSMWDCHILTDKANTVPVTDLSASFLSEVYGTDGSALSAIIMPAAATAWT